MHVAVTGASSGIGEALAREYARAGAALTLVARRRELLEKLRAELPGAKIRVVTHDLSVVENATAWIADAQAEQGPFDVFINNAGVQIVGPHDEEDVEKGEALLRTNLLTPMRIARVVLHEMRARGSGTLVNVASLAAIAPTPHMAYYSASKAGIGAASECMRGEMLGSGVNVVTVYPGPVDSAMARAAVALFEPSATMQRMPTGDAAELARIVRGCVEERGARIIYPRIYEAARWFPGITRWVLDNFMPKIVKP